MWLVLSVDEVGANETVWQLYLGQIEIRIWMLENRQGFNVVSIVDA
jgi:hypothetical protein